jgi:hypothetical protein
MVRAMTLARLAVALLTAVLAAAGMAAGPASAAVTGLVSTPAGSGYWLAYSDGAVVARGAAGFHGDVAAFSLNKPISAIVAARDGAGYRLFGRDGGAFSFGSAPALNPGSLAGYPLNGEIVAAVSSPSGNGYRMVGTDGGVFNFGDSQALSPGSLANSPPGPGGAIVGVAGTPSGSGYWLAGRDGGVYRFGDAPPLPDLRGIALSAPIVGIAAHGAAGYWLLGGDGGVFAFGSAPFLGGLGGRTLTAPAVAIARTPGAEGGYRVALADGTVYAFDQAPGTGAAPAVTGNVQAGGDTGPPPASAAGTAPPAGLKRLARRPKARLGLAWVRRSGVRRLVGLDYVEVVNVVRGARVRLLCSSGRRACPFARSSVRTVRGGIVTFRSRRTLRGVASIRVLVTQRNRLGSYTSWRAQRGQPLSGVIRSKRDACVLFGSTKPIRCR